MKTARPTAGRSSSRRAPYAGRREHADSGAPAGHVVAPRVDRRGAARPVRRLRRRPRRRHPPRPQPVRDRGRRDHARRRAPRLGGGPAGATGATRAHAYRAHPDDRAREATELVPLNRARSASAREAVTGRSRYRRRFATRSRCSGRRSDCHHLERGASASGSRREVAEPAEDAFGLSAAAPSKPPRTVMPCTFERCPLVTRPSRRPAKPLLRRGSESLQHQAIQQPPGRGLNPATPSVARGSGHPNRSGTREPRV